MGYLPSRPVERLHRCANSGRTYTHREGERWQCDACGKVWCVEQRIDRGDLELQWIEETNG